MFNDFHHIYIHIQTEWQSYPRWSCVECINYHPNNYFTLQEGKDTNNLSYSALTQEKYKVVKLLVCHIARKLYKNKQCIFKAMNDNGFMPCLEYFQPYCCCSKPKVLKLFVVHRQWQICLSQNQLRILTGWVGHIALLPYDIT